MRWWLGLLYLLIGSTVFATPAAAQVGCSVTISANAGIEILDDVVNHSECLQSNNSRTFVTSGAFINFVDGTYGNTLNRNGTTSGAGNTNDDRLVTSKGAVTYGRRNSGGTATSLYYNPANNAGGVDNFQVDITSGDGTKVNRVTYTVNITPKPPVTSSFASTVAFGSSGNVLKPTYDTTNAGPPTGVTVVTGPTNGTVSASGTNFLYTPNTGTYGSDSFTFYASNGGGNSSTQTATITITEPTPTVTSVSPNTGPIGGGGTVTIGGTNFGRTSDTDKPTVKFGTVVVADANVTYTGPTQLTVIVPAAAGGTAGTTNVFVQNSANTSSAATANQYSYVASPVANAQSVTTAFNTAKPITLTASNTPTSYAYTQPAQGTGTVSGTGPNVTYTPPTGYAGTASFTFTATNAGGTSAPATVTVTTAKGDQTITYSSTAPANARVGGSYTVAATASSGLAVSFSIDPQSNAVCALGSGNSVSFTGTGTCTIYADQPGNTTYNAAPRATQAFQVAKSDQTITFTSSQPTANVGGTYAVSATATSGLPVAFTSGTTGVCTISGNTVSFVAPGTCTVNADQSGNASYNAAPRAQQTIAVAKANQSITYTSTPPSNARVGGTYAVSATATSNLAVAFTSATTGVCTVSGGTVSFVAPGTCTINADQPGDASYNAAPRVQQSVTVAAAPPVADDRSATTTYDTAVQITVTASGNPTGYAKASDPAHGTVTNNGAVFTYTPTAGYSGADSFTFTASNAGGTSAPATVSITVSPPAAPAQPTVTAPANGATLAMTTPTVTGTTAAGTSVAIYIDGANRGAATVSGTGFSFTSPALSQGSHTVYAIASNAGVASPASATNTFTVDTVAPVAPVITAPVEGGSVASATPTISGTAEASARVTVSVDGTVGSPVTADGAGNFSYTSATLARGTHSATATATDAAGNVSPTSTARTFTYATAPQVTGVAPAQGSTAGGQRITISGSGFSGTDAATGVTIGGAAASNVAVSDTQITATTPAGTAGQTSVQVTNAAGSGSAAYTYLAPPTANAQDVAVAYGATNQPITLTGINATSFTVVAGSGPAHGTLSGSAPNLVYTPTSGYSGPDGFAFYTTNGSGAGAPQSVAATVSITVGPAAPVVQTNPQNQSVVAGATATFTASASGNPTVQWQRSSGGSGFTDIAGAAGTSYSFTVTQADDGTAYRAVFTNGGGTATTSAATLTVTSAPVVTRNPADATVAAGRTASFSAAASGSPAPTVQWQVSSDGNAFANVAGATGTTYSFTATAADDGKYYRAVFTNGTGTATTTAARLSVNSAPTVTAVSPNQGPASGGTAITITGTNFTGVAADGVTIGGQRAANVAVSGNSITATTPAGSAGSAPVVVTNSVGASDGSATFTYVAAPVAQPQTVSVGYGTARTITLSATGNVSSYAYTQPGHGSVSGTGPDVTYTPTAGYRGADSFTFTATGTGGTSNVATIGVTVGDPTLSVTGTPPAGQRGTSYSAQLTASGGTAPYSFTIASGALPPGLTLTSSGATATIGGTPGASGTFQVAFTVTDSSNPAASVTTPTYTIQIAAPSAQLAPAAGALPGGTVGEAYAQTFSTTGTGTTEPHTYTVTGTLPAGLSLSGATISGTPRMAGDYSFSVQSTDSSGAATGGPYTTSAAYTLRIGSPTVTVAPAGGLPDAKVGAAYSQQASASGGTGPYGFAVTAGALPAGLTLSNDGLISGTPTAGGSFAFTLTATDSSTGAGAPFRGSRAYTLTVAAPALTLAPTRLADGSTNTAYSQTVVTSGGTAPYSYTASGTVPPGLTLAVNGTLSGKPSQAGSYTFTVTARDSSTGTGPFSQAYTYTLAIQAPAIALSPASLPNAKVAAAYGQTLSASGGNGTYTYEVASGALPAGLALSSGGVLSGTPTAGGSFGFTVRASDANGNAGTRAYTLVVDAATIAVAPDALPNATRNIAYAATLTASGGTGSYAFAVTAGTLPAGLTLAANGTLSGRATQAGSFAFTVTATDASTGTGPYTGTRNYTLAVDAPAIVLAPAALPNATTRIGYSQTLTASGGTAPYTFAVTAGALPAGITLASDGTLSGSAAAAGSYTFTVTATDANGNAGAKSYTLNVVAPAIVLAPDALPGATVGASYSRTIGASGGMAPYTFSVSAGALPAGIVLAADGTLSGTPTAAGSFAVTITATDASGNGSSRSYTLIVAAPTVAIAPQALPDGTVRAAYSQTLSAAGGTAPYSYGVSAGTLPAGITLGTDGTLTGTPTQSGGFAFTVRVTDSSGGSGPFSATRDYTLTIAAPALTLAPATLDAATVGASYRTQLAATGGTAPYSYRVASGTLPTGLTLGTDGTLAGTPSAAGSFQFTVAASDATASRDGGPYAATRGYTLTIAAPTLAIVPANLPDGAYRMAYSQQLSASGGTAPYTYRVTGGALPTGVTLAANGIVSGTPTAVGRFEATVTATDSSTGSGPFSTGRTVTLTIQPPARPVAGDVAATVVYGSAANVIQPKLASGAADGYALASQPAHGSASVDGGTLVYTPASGYAGPDSFTYTATNAGGVSAAATVAVTVSPATVNVTPATLPDARQGEAYSQQLTASGGSAPYGYAIAGGTLPAGLSLSPTGLLSGTPSASGTATFAIRATDASTGAGPFIGTRSYTIAVALPAAPTIRAIPTIDAQGSSTAANGATDIVLSDYVAGAFTDIEIASQPTNGSLTIARSGTRIVATYVPHANFAGRDGFAVVAVGPGGRSAATAVTLAVTGTAPVAASLTATTTQGVPVSVDLTAGATGGPFTGAVVTGVSPAGQVTTEIVESGSAGLRTYRLTLTPALTFSGTATIGYTLSNQFGASRAASVTLTVAARPDPSSDPAVNAVSAAQADAARRFVRTQTDNFFRRNEQLHNGGTGTGGARIGTTVGLGFGALIRPNAVQQGATDLGELKTQQGRGLLNAPRTDGLVDGFGMPGVPARMAGGSGPNGAVDGTTRDVAGVAPQAEGNAGGTAVPGERRIGSVGIWSGGAVTVGAWDASTRRAKMAITTGGLSAGADIKLADSLIVGLGGGYGHDATRIAGGRADVRGDSWSVAGYGSWSPTDGIFLDGIAGAGSLSFDTRRRIAATGADALGNRDGRTIFGSVAAGVDLTGGPINFEAYGRADYLSARLDRFTERGGGIYDLTFAKRNLDSLAGVLGTRIAYPMGIAVPRLRAEWRHEFADTGTQLVDYSDAANLRYATRGDIWLRDAVSLDLGVDLSLGRGWALTTEVGGTKGSGATAGTGRIGVRKTF